MTAALQRYRALTLKEFRQLRRNRSLLVQLVVPPSVVLVLFGFALNFDIQHLRTGVVDESRTPQSRELLAALTDFEAFEVTASYQSAAAAAEAMERRALDLAIVVPRDYADALQRGRPARVQIIVDAVNANTAVIVRGYLARTMADYNDRLIAGRTVTASFAAQPTTASAPRFDVGTAAIVLYNPGLRSAWFAVTGVMSLLIFINGALVASAVTVREKEIGTIEQLLIGPAQTTEILLAKTTPVVVLLMADLLLALFLSWLVFGLPLRGSLLLLLAAGVLAGLAGTGIGVMIATFSTTQQQAQLLTFFLLPPLVLLSGAFTPVEGMPLWLQRISVVDPLPYLLTVVRGITLKAAGLRLLWPDLAVLTAFAIVLYGISAWRFRKHLGS